MKKFCPNTPSIVVLAWRKSSHSSNGGHCVEVSDGFPGVVPVRDSKDADGPVLAFGVGAWAAFVAGVKAGDFPIPN